MYSFRILENYSKDMFHSSILRFDKTSYLFNCCDGTQRNALDQGIKFQKIKAIFLPLRYCCSVPFFLASLSSADKSSSD